MNWEEFKFVCFSQGIDQDAVETCKDFVFKENGYVFNRGTRHPESDLGYAELRDITSPIQSIKELKECQMYATMGETTRQTNNLKKKFKKDPGKNFHRVVLKAYYLNDGVFELKT